MNYENDRLQPDEIAVSISRIIRQCLGNIKLIIIMAIVGAVLTSGLFYFLDLKAYNNQKQPSEAPVEIQLSAEEEVLVNKYFLLKAKVEQLELEMKKTEMSQIDMSNAYQIDLVYYVDTEEDIRFDIAYALVSSLNNYQVEDGKGLVYVNHVGKDAGISSGVLTINICSAQESYCKELSEEIKGFMKDTSTSLQNKMGMHELRILREEAFCGYAAVMYANYRVVYEDYNSVKTNFNVCKNALSDKQQQAVTQEENSSDDTMNNVKVAKPSISFKLAILGAIVGVVLAVVYVIVVVLFSGRLQVVNEIKRRLNYECLGLVNSKLDQMIKVCDSVELSLEGQPTKGIVFFSSLNISNIPQYKALSDALAQRGIKIDIYENVTNDLQILSKSKNAKNVVILEEIGCTKVKELYMEAQICNQIKSNVLGYIVIDK